MSLGEPDCTISEAFGWSFDCTGDWNPVSFHPEKLSTTVIRFSGSIWSRLSMKKHADRYLSYFNLEIDDSFCVSDDPLTRYSGTSGFCERDGHRLNVFNVFVKHGGKTFVICYHRPWKNGRGLIHLRLIIDRGNRHLAYEHNENTQTAILLRMWCWMIMTPKNRSSRLLLCFSSCGTFFYQRIGYDIWIERCELGILRNVFHRCDHWTWDDQW